MAQTSDVKLLRVGAEGLHEPVAAPLKANVTVFCGTIALLNSSGVLKNSAVPVSTDVCVGMIDEPTGGTYVKVGPGIVGGTTDGSVWIDCATGSFILQSGTGADTLSAATAGKIVYVVDEITVGLTSGGGTRPIAGVQLPIDPTIPAGFVPVKFSTPAS